MEPALKLTFESMVNGSEPDGPKTSETSNGDLDILVQSRIERNPGKDSSDELNGGLKRKLDDTQTSSDGETRSRKKGIASIKPEFLVHNVTGPNEDHITAENSTDRRKKAKGQNTNRSFGSSRDAIALCATRQNRPEFSPKQCHFGSACKYEHDLRRYLKEGKRANLETFGGKCPVFYTSGTCNAGWRCRFVGSHSEERKLEDGRLELVLVEQGSASSNDRQKNEDDDEELNSGIFNTVPASIKNDLRKKRIATEKADKYTKWLEDTTDRTCGATSSITKDEDAVSRETNGDQEVRAQYKEAPFLPSEKRRIYYGPETPVLAPLTTQGNLPFRRLCVELGAQVTWSEMAMSQPLINGEKSEWALMKAHESEISPPSRSESNIVEGYENAKDLKFGVQISGNKPWVTLKATEILTTLCPHLRAIDLNCGCPIDLVYRQGAGSALLDSPSKLEKILRGMNAVSGEVPITAKIRTGVKDDRPTATKLIDRLAFGSQFSADNGLGPPGVAAITLHGRSRQQRYTKSADWKYISECAALIKDLNAKKASRIDTTKEMDPRYLPANLKGKVYFLGNGDCYSHTDYFEHIEQAKVDSVMVARGALIKPWVFEEIERGQYLDKSSRERLDYIEKFARYGLQTWGSDEVGVGTTRRFLLEWLSFSCRYVPLGLLEYMPPKINDRPPAFRGRDELETLLSSDNYKDWIKISEMFLGPAHPDFRFEPKHKSNAYTDIEG